jgi:D-lactate dehydrogenase (cytochrome)
MNAPLPAHLLPHVEPRPVPAVLIDALRARFGDRFSTANAVREQHGRDESPFAVRAPDGVVFCESTADVSDAVRMAAEHSVPVIAFGTGSSLEGHLLAVQGGISLDVNRMDKVLRVSAEDLLVTVQPGVTREQLNREIKDTGLFFPIDPGANASLGGMAATRASGTNAVRYGTMRENVLALEVVTASGEVIRTGTRAKKSSAGYDLTRLMVGSEGTLGIITEVTLKLYPLPEAVSAAICHFPDEGAAVNATIQLIQLGVPIARCELLDANAVQAVNRHAKLSLSERPMLLMEFHGSPASVAEQAQTVQEIAAGFGGENFEWATTPEDRSRLWAARHQAYFAGMSMYPGCRTVTTDTCVPISQLADCVVAAKREAQDAGLPHYIVGHVGDGNFHIAYIVNPDKPNERERAEALNERVVQRAIACGGTCTGEHGIGLHKQGFLVEETGAGSVEMMRLLKRALDPKNILNPGKIFTL